jgi:hypothetical protein
MSSSNSGIKSKFAALSLVLVLLVLWLIMHGYHGLTGDGQIYAFQAFARLHPQLATDLYLQNTSQDQFTVFSPPYAWCIRWLGLERAAGLLTLLFTLWFLLGSWTFARSFTTRDAAWATIAFLLIVDESYGGSGVFRVLDPFLTARLPAEALTITALGLYVRGKKLLGLSLAMGALFIHPLMALPGLLFIVCLWAPVSVGVIGALGGVLATLAVAILSAQTAPASHLLTVMDAPWLDVVRERSQFLFLQLWSIQDLDTNARPFIYVVFTAIAVKDERIRKLCLAAALVGAAGLLVALIGSLIGPIAILVQGQAWRWVWITVFIGAVLTPFTVLQVWRDRACGPLCALLLVLGWTLPWAYGAVCAGLALMFWLGRARITLRVAINLRWGSALLGIAIAAWMLAKCWTFVPSPFSQFTHATSGASRLQGISYLRIPAVLLAALLWWRSCVSRTAWEPPFLAAMLAAFSALIFPAAFKQARTLASPTEIREFAPWAEIIPPTSTVLVTPPHDVGAFVWFTLGRPNYLTLDQSAGVVFSRATALEVRRRSLVLLPLMDPDWEVLDSLRAESANPRIHEGTTRPLTIERLILVCADPQLGFVISEKNIDFGTLLHERVGAMKDWSLYDCRKVRSSSPS